MASETSEPVKAIRYDADRQRLVVRFVDGCEVAFVGVPGEVHRSFAAATSKDLFLADQISGRFPFQRLS